MIDGFSQPAAPPRRGVHGFTLVELLVVMAIISILAGLLLPVLKKARDAAHTAACMNNVKQIALGFYLYLEDYRGTPPYAYYWGGEDGYGMNRYCNVYLDGRFNGGGMGKSWNLAHIQGIYRCPLNVIPPAINGYASHYVQNYDLGNKTSTSPGTYYALRPGYTVMYAVPSYFRYRRPGALATHVCRKYDEGSGGLSYGHATFLSEYFWGHANGCGVAVFLDSHAKSLSYPEATTYDANYGPLAVLRDQGVGP